ncbi:TetR/AcrR family transcriptional regulator [Kutzneria sp. CA-103260]|uniref:TetR/AcrR family transcriptional regulator n=1 Tax=Kutzneria sp. CA-103260 TaxID=2802641 RepID=UPI001BEF35FB|nr:TetR/AcrR family transcriptional regulator [Kutzneria sp. CA-103260]QUQ62342.1 TetR family transcriptional regulator [Kutzneria sp. CA-103260]
MADTTQRVRNPWGQGERLRLEILEAAARLLSELGGEQGLTIRGVARAAGIAPASIYQHFADKAALVKGLLDYDYEILSAAMAKADAACPEDEVLDRVRAQVRAYCQFALDSPGHYRLMINNRPVDVPRTGPLVDIVHQVVKAFERCERAGVRLRVPAQRAAIVVFVAAHGRVALWHASEDPAQAEAILDFVDEVVWLVTE